MGWLFKTKEEKEIRRLVKAHRVQFNAKVIGCSIPHTGPLAGLASVQGDDMTWVRLLTAMDNVFEDLLCFFLCLEKKNKSPNASVVGLIKNTSHRRLFQASPRNAVITLQKELGDFLENAEAQKRKVPRRDQQEFQNIRKCHDFLIDKTKKLIQQVPNLLQKAGPFR